MAPRGIEYFNAVRKHWVSVAITGGVPAGIGLGLVIANASLALPWWGWLNLAGLGVFVAQYLAWRDVAKDRDQLRAELEALVGERAAAKPIPSEHVAELKAMLQRVQRAVQNHGPIAYGDGPHEREAIFQEAFNTHYPDLVPIVISWDFARFQCATLDGTIQALAAERTNDLMKLGVVPHAVANVINQIRRVTSGQEPYPNGWKGWKTPGDNPINVEWNGQLVAQVDTNDAAAIAMEAYAKLLEDAPQWQQVKDLSAATLNLDSITQNLVNHLAHEYARHMTHTRNLCAMCPETP